MRVLRSLALLFLVLVVAIFVISVIHANLTDQRTIGRVIHTSM